MGMFDISLVKKVKIKKTKQDFLEFLERRLTKDKTYETNTQNNILTIQKSHIDTLLKYNLNAEIKTSKKENELIINAELHDTLILTIVIVLAILLTYGIGVVFVVAFTYLQRRKGTKYLESIITDYETIN
jgi:hypothetical protein